MTTSEVNATGAPPGGTSIHGIRLRLVTTVRSRASASSSETSGTADCAYSDDTEVRAGRGEPASGTSETADTASDSSGNSSPGATTDGRAIAAVSGDGRVRGTSAIGAAGSEADRCARRDGVLQGASGGSGSAPA